MLITIKGEIHSNTIIAEDFNTPLSPMDRPSKMKINKETEGLNDMYTWERPGKLSNLTKWLKPSLKYHF